MELTNTLDGRKAEFTPSQPGRVSIYVCGPTVYDVAHIGHARAAVVFDVLRRHLAWRGYDVLFVRNITDVDDKIIARSRELGVDTAVVAERYTRAYDRVMEALGVQPPDIAPRASGHIPEMIEMIAKLVDRGFAYPAQGSVYYAVEKFDGYGRLSGRSLDEMSVRERVEPAPGKHHPLDFALWKASKPAEPAWDSPWGRGRPGWHIECSAMSVRYLGPTFDIHGGGSDLIFPHHENEIAQAEAATGHRFARWWLHNGHVQISGEKMSKSLRNYVLVDEVLADYDPRVLRLFLLQAHYRSQIAYSPEQLGETATVWRRFEAFLRAAPGDGQADDRDLDAFAAAMDDDLNTPAAIAALHGLVSEGNRALESGDCERAARARAGLVVALGVLGCDPHAPAQAQDRERVRALVELLLEMREQARARKDFQSADEIRDRLGAAGVRVEDTAQGARWDLQ